MSVFVGYPDLFGHIRAAETGVLEKFQGLEIDVISSGERGGCIETREKSASTVHWPISPLKSSISLLSEALCPASAGLVPSKLRCLCAFSAPGAPREQATPN